METISLQQTQAITCLATLLCDFLPGTAHPYSKIKIDFGTIAKDLGLAEYWQGGSKRPALEKLIESTLTEKRAKFCSLMIKIVQEGIKYRHKKGQSVTQENINELNKLIETVGFKIPELREKAFIDSLPNTVLQVSESGTNNPKIIDVNQLKKLNEDFLSLEQLNSQARGFALEKFLYRLFDLYHFNPRPSFRNVGEQIDGSLEFAHDYYLIEAKWQMAPTNYSDIMAFNGKVSAHSSIGRGIFITTGNFSTQALEAYSKAQQRAPLIGIDGQDLYFILNDNLALDEVIKEKIRRLIESGQFHYPVNVFKSKIKSYK